MSLGPLTLSTLTPVDGTAGAARTASVSARFGSDIAASTLTANNVSLVSPNGVALPAALTAAGSGLLLTPSFALPGDTTYTMRISNALADTAGRTLAAPVSASFTTAAQAWGKAPTKLDTLAKSLYSYEYPAAVVDRSGNVTATWVRSYASGLYTSRFDAATATWSTASLLYESPDKTIKQGPLLAAPNGDVFQYWLEGKFVEPNLEQPQLRYMRFDKASATWSTAATASILPAGHYIGRLDMAIDAAGAVTALVTNQSMAGEHAVYAVRLDRAGASWGAPVRLDRPGARASGVFYMGIAADSAGNVFAAWSDTGPVDAVFAARYDIAQGRWTPAQQLSAPGAFGGYPGSLSVSAAGVAVSAWREPSSVEGAVAKLSRFDPVSKTWSAAQRLDNASDGATDPMAVVDADGSIVASWKQSLSKVYVRRFDAATSQWSAPRHVAADAYSSVTERRMAMDVAGNVIMIVVENNKMKALRYRSSDKSWSAAAPIDTEFGSEKVIHEPVLVMDPSGVATAAWFVRNEPSVFFYQNEMITNRFR